MADQDTRVAQLVASVGAALNADLAGLTRQIHRRLSTEIEELKGDERILQLLGSSIEGNVDTILHMFQHGIGIERVEPPSAAFEYSRRLAERASPSRRPSRNAAAQSAAIASTSNSPFTPAIGSATQC